MKINFSDYKQLFKASYFNTIIVLVRVLSGVVLSKVVAYFLGPTGLAFLGNFRNFIKVATSFTAEGYQNGTVRYISEFRNNSEEKDRIIATVFQLSLSLAIIIGVVLYSFSSSWSVYLFKTNVYSSLIKALGISLPFLSFNLLIIYVLNGLEHYKKLVLVNSILSLVNMLIVIILTVNYGIKGALLGVVISPVIVFLIILVALGKDRLLFLSVFRLNKFSFNVLKNMNVYLLMSIYATVIVSVTFLSIRNLVIEKLSLQEAGYWEAMNRVSSFYLMFFLSLTSFYLLPQLSKITNFKFFKKEIKRFYSLIIPALLVAFVLIYFLRFFLLKLFLSEEFLPTSKLFFWQLIGDFMSVLAIALVKQFHAKLMIKAYLISNGLLNLLYFCLSYFFIDKFGLEGIVKAYAISYFIYLLVVTIFVINYYKTHDAN